MTEREQNLNQPEAAEQLKESEVSYLDLIGNFDEELLNDLAPKILETITSDNIKKIYFIISSSGGASTVGQALIELNKLTQKEIAALVMGTAMSTAFAFLQSVDTRFATENSILLIHPLFNQPSADERLRNVELEDWLKLNKRVFPILENISASRLGKSLKQIREEEFPNRFAWANQAKELGWIDNVATPPEKQKVTNVSKEQIAHVNLTGDLTVAKIKSLFRQLKQIEEDDNKKMIRAYLSGGGHNLYPALTVHELFRFTGKPIEAVMLGPISFEHLLIAAGADYRTASNSSTLVFSLGKQRNTLFEDFPTLASDIKLDQTLNRKYFELIAAASGAPDRVDQLEKTFSVPKRFMTPQQAKRFGFVNEIVKTL